MTKRSKRKIKAHAARRAAERYGLTIGEDTLVRIGKHIRTVGWLECRSTSLTRTVGTILFEGKVLRVVYSKKAKRPLTFLPLEDSDDSKSDG